MARFRQSLPQLTGELFLTDGGIETSLIYHDGIDLPHFAAFHLLTSETGRETLRSYYRRYTRIAGAHGLGFVLESATWRANPDWGARLGYSHDALGDVNREAIRILEEIRTEYDATVRNMVLSGCIGPRSDGYTPTDLMSEGKAQRYHTPQIETFAETETDMVTAITMTNTSEAIGIARAAETAGMPAAISFTVETDGRLPSGESLGEAIDAVDAATGQAPAYYMINCAHPTHFEDALRAGERWTSRVRGLRANASSKSHAELDQMETLDEGDPVELGAQYRELRQSHPGLSVLGGCCGTDHRHIAEICKAVV